MFCGYSKDAAMFDATPIDNMFLLEYMPDAPEGFVRVYLYARMLCQHPELGGELADVAKALHMEEDAVLNAMSYWEQQGLAEKLSDRPASYAMPPLRAGVAVRAQADQDYYKYRKFNSSLQALFGESELLEPRQYRMANDWLTLLGFTEEAALKLVEYELRQPGGKRSASVFKRADKRALDWAERGIHTAGDVERAISYDQQVYDMATAVLKQLSIGRKPTVNELDDVRRWIGEWKLSTQDVLDACGETTKSRAPSIAYLDAILKARMERGANPNFEALKGVLRELNAASSTPTPEQAKVYGEFLDRGFEPETVRLAAVQCARKNKRQFADLEWMLNSWGDAGVRTRAEAERYIAEMQRRNGEMAAVLKAAGVERRPNMGDLERYEAWRANHSPELILCAAELAKGARAPLPYMDKLLSNWKQAGIATPEAARAEGARRAKEAAPAGGAAPARNYQQHAYSAADFGDDFYYDPSKDYPEGGEAK